MKKLMILAILAVIAMAIIDLTYHETVKPDAVYPMANQHIEWTH